MTSSSRRWVYAAWLVVIGVFAILHALHLRADFPNHSPWYMDWAKYTDEGWYGNAAVRAHLFGNWYMPGDFNPAPAVPVWPFLEWLLFFATGVTVQAARGLAVGFFFANLVLSYLLLRLRGPRWVALLALTLLVTSPFLYCFSRLAILEPMLTTLALGVLNLAVRLPRFRRPVWASAWIGVLFTLMMLTKTTAVFLLPAVGWALILPLWHNRKLAIRCAVAASGAFAATFGLWMGLVIRFGLFPDYQYLFFVNKYVKPREFYWPVVSFWWSFHGGLWIDHILIPLAGLVVIGAVVTGAVIGRRWGRKLLLDPVFGSSILAAAGYIFFMTYQNHPQPRYFAVVAFFTFFVVAQGAGALLDTQAAEKLAPPGIRQRLVTGHDFSRADKPNQMIVGLQPLRDAFGIATPNQPFSAASTAQSALPDAPKNADRPAGSRHVLARILGWGVVGLACLAALENSALTVSYAAHPEYTFVDAAQRLTRYIDTDPSGNRLLLSISGDQITLVSHLPSICDDFGTQELVSKLGRYQPGWWATWNDIDPGTLEDLHNRYSLEQVASFRAFDDPDRNLLVLFKLHPLPGGQMRDPTRQNLQVKLPGDKFAIPIE